MDATEEKRARARSYLHHLGTQGLCFSGISGSVSYDAEPDDDIDVFLIARDRHLWRSLARAFLVRRLRKDPDICVSLTMDASHAAHLFGGNGDYLLANDSVHVISFHGHEFYEHLLAGSPFVREYFPERARGPEQGAPTPPVSSSLLEYVIFFALAPYLAAGALLENWRVTRRYGPERSFRPRISLHYYFLDTYKYHQLRLRYEGVPSPGHPIPAAGGTTGAI